MSLKSKDVFVTNEGVNYLLHKYLVSSDMDYLFSLNDGFHNRMFEEELINRIIINSGGKNFISSNYLGELVENAKSIIGYNISKKRLKTRNKKVKVINTFEGDNIYQDKNGRFRDYGTGRYIKKPKNR